MLFLIFPNLKQQMHLSFTGKRNCSKAFKLYFSCFTEHNNKVPHATEILLAFLHHRTLLTSGPQPLWLLRLASRSLGEHGVHLAEPSTQGQDQGCVQMEGLRIRTVGQDKCLEPQDHQPNSAQQGLSIDMVLPWDACRRVLSDADLPVSTACPAGHEL